MLIFQEKICEESASFDLSSLDLATAIEETTKLAEKLADLSSNEAMMSEEADPVGESMANTVNPPCWADP